MASKTTATTCIYRMSLSNKQWCHSSNISIHCGSRPQKGSLIFTAPGLWKWKPERQSGHYNILLPLGGSRKMIYDHNTTFFSLFIWFLNIWGNGSPKFSLLLGSFVQQNTHHFLDIHQFHIVVWCIIIYILQQLINIRTLDFDTSVASTRHFISLNTHMQIIKIY